MTLEENTIDTSAQHEVEDTSGLVEIQQAMDEIEKLKNQDNNEVQEAVEQEEVSATETVEEEQEDTSKEDPVKKEKKGDKLRKLQNDKYRALAEKETLAQENEHLKKLLDESLNSGTYHYSKSAFSDLERAKANKKRAIENGDIDALIESDIELTRALTTVSDLEKWNNETARKEEVPQYQNNYNQIKEEIASDWLDNHTYLQPTSRNYNAKLATQVSEFVNHLDNNLAKNNQMDVYFSEEYFDTIEKYIDSVVNEPPKTTKAPAPQAHVGSVRNSYNSGGNGKSSSPTQISLSADERRMCANAGISEQEWIKYKLLDLQKEGKRA